MDISFLFLLFIVYSFMGWLWEEIYCSLHERKLVNRGFLHGPICPVYGIGGILVIKLLQPFNDNIFTLFTMSVVVVSVLEYVTSWILETIFSTRWWDYSACRFNIHGRVWLVSSLTFGFMSVLVVRLVHPSVVLTLELLPHESRNMLSAIIGLILFVDFAMTLKTLVNIDEKLVALKEFTESLRDRLDIMAWFNELDLQGSLERLKKTAPGDNPESFARLVLRFEKMLEHPNGMLRIFRAFPGMQSKNHNSQLDLLKRLGNVGDKAKGQPLQQSQMRTSEIEKEIPSTVFASGYDFYKLFLIFFIASFLGVMLEMIWCVFSRGHLESRTGLVYGMLNPVYGLGGLFMTLFFTRRQKSRDLRVFIDNMIIGGIAEYICSLGQELIFGTISWEYSKVRFNINNRTDLLYIVIWGVLGLVWVREIFPVLSKMIEQIPVKLGKTLTVVLFAAMLADMGITALAVSRWTERHNAVESSTKVDAFLDEHYPDSFMQSVFPNMVFVEKKQS